jgi:hypothetical protein
MGGGRNWILCPPTGSDDHIAARILRQTVPLVKTRIKNPIFISISAEWPLPAWMVLVFRSRAITGSQRSPDCQCCQDCQKQLAAALSADRPGSMLKAPFEWNFICYSHGWENAHSGVEILMLAIIFAADVLYGLGPII